MGGEPDRQATSTRQWRAAARAGGGLAAGGGVSVSQCFVASCGQAVVDGNTGDGRSGQTSMLDLTRASQELKSRDETR